MTPSGQQQLLNVQIDGEWKQFPQGTRLIEACMQEGRFIPHYCYHPKLSSPGNCRMCLVELGMPKLSVDRKPVAGPDGFPEIVWSPRPAISCATEISEGMAVRTASPMAEECRRGVMEFLLINHPLDCPICDQAGECRLQEFSVEFGKGESRFLEEKVKKPKRVDIGARIVLDDERCILCSRCIRFMQEIAMDDVLGFINRGSHTTLTVHPGRRLDSNYSLNTADICPVGALTSKDFRFKMRVWFLRETKSIDVNCGTGCNILVGSRENTIHRITPRDNDFVNGCWMPDSHRLAFHPVNSPDRLKEPVVHGAPLPPTWPEAVAAVAERLKEAAGGMAMIASARMTCEEMHLARRLAEALGITLFDVPPRPQEGDGFLVSPDGNPNTTGARLLGLATGRLGEIVAGVRSGALRALLVLGEDAAGCGLAPEDLDTLKTLVAVATLPSPTTLRAHVVLPSASWAEKRGTMINTRGRIQRLNRAIASPGNARDDWEILRDLLHAVTGRDEGSSVSAIFKAMAAEHEPLHGLTLAGIGDLGVDLSDKLRGRVAIESSPVPTRAPHPV
jgi:NADH-quinone oxidoreductase subunit G